MSDLNLNEPVANETLRLAFAKYDVRSFGSESGKRSVIIGNCGRNFDRTRTFTGKTWDVVLRKVSAAFD